MNLLWVFYLEAEGLGQFTLLQPNEVWNRKISNNIFWCFIFFIFFIFYSCVTFGYTRKVSCVINEKVKIRIRRKLKLHCKKGIMLWGNVKVPSKSDDHSFMFSSPTVIRNGALYVASCPGCLHQRTKKQSIVLLFFLIMQYRWVTNAYFS